MAVEVLAEILDKYAGKKITVLVRCASLVDRH